MPGSRINVRGVSGAGKTTFAVELARRLGVPHIELDALHHGPNWAEPTVDEFRTRVRSAMAAAPHGWVIDGNYDSKLASLVIDAADSVVWLDVPLHVAMLRLWNRTSRRIRGNVELWNGNRESWRTALWGREALFTWTLRSYFKHRRARPKRFDGRPGFVRLRTASAIQRWLDAASSDLRVRAGEPSSPSSRPG